MSQIDDVLGLLKKDQNKNYCAIRLLSRMESPQLILCGKAVMVREKRPNGDFVILVPAGKDDTIQLLGSIKPNDTDFYIIEDWPVSNIIKDSDVKFHLDCYQYHLPETYVLPEDDPRVRDINDAYTDYIYERYDHSEDVDLDYVRNRLAEGPAVGVFEEEGLIAWAFLHDEGSMGFLTVLPEYRRRGLASILSIALCRRVREWGGIPTVHIVKTNEPSMALSRKMGFVRNADVHWLGLK